MSIQDFIKKNEKEPVQHYPNRVNKASAVSVCVQTYQHEKLIEQCLDSILEQQTTFDFEILIGEDASADKTREICTQYAEKYPDKIRLFLHSRKNNVKIGGTPTGRFNAMYNFLQANGEFIALCEGDDYWTDPLKLQKQYDAMKDHTDCSVCFTSSEVVKMQDGEEIGSEIYRPNEAAELKKYSVSDGIIHKGALMPTASMFFYTHYVNDFPEWIFTAPMGDIPLTLFLGARGEYLYLDDVTCAYRLGVTGSWTTIMNYEKRRKTVKSLISLFQEFDMYTNFEHHNLIKKEIRTFRINDFKSAFRHTFRPIKSWILRKNSPAD